MEVLWEVLGFRCLALIKLILSARKQGHRVKSSITVPCFQRQICWQMRWQTNTPNTSTRAKQNLHCMLWRVLESLSVDSASRLPLN